MQKFIGTSFAYEQIRNLNYSTVYVYVNAHKVHSVTFYVMPSQASVYPGGLLSDSRVFTLHGGIHQYPSLMQYAA
jgi:hypothetical protein